MFHQHAIYNMLFYSFSSKSDIKQIHNPEPNDRSLNDEHECHFLLIFQIYYDNLMHILVSSNGYSNHIFVKLFILGIVHIWTSFA